MFVNCCSKPQSLQLTARWKRLTNAQIFLWTSALQAIPELPLTFSSYIIYSRDIHACTKHRILDLRKPSSFSLIQITCKKQGKKEHKEATTHLSTDINPIFFPPPTNISDTYWCLHRSWRSHWSTAFFLPPTSEYLWHTEVQNQQTLVPILLLK